MGVLGRVARDLPTGVGEGPPSVADSGGSRCPQSAPPGLTGEELQADIRVSLSATMLPPSGLGAACQALKSARVSTRPVITSLALTPFGWSTNADSPGPGSRWLTHCPGSCRYSERLPLPSRPTSQIRHPGVAGVAHGVVPAKLHAAERRTLVRTPALRSLAATALRRCPGAPPTSGWLSADVPLPPETRPRRLETDASVSSSVPGPKTPATAA